MYCSCPVTKVSNISFRRYCRCSMFRQIRAYGFKLSIWFEKCINVFLHFLSLSQTNRSRVNTITFRQRSGRCNWHSYDRLYGKWQKLSTKLESPLIALCMFFWRMFMFMKKYLLFCFNQKSCWNFSPYV